MSSVHLVLVIMNSFPPPGVELDLLGERLVLHSLRFVTGVGFQPQSGAGQHDGFLDCFSGK